MTYAAFALADFHQTTRKDNWRQAVHDLERAAAPGDAVVFHPFFTEISWSIYRTRTIFGSRRSRSTPARSPRRP